MSYMKLVPADEAHELAMSLIEEYGGVKPAARAMQARHGVSYGSARKSLIRLKHLRGRMGPLYYVRYETYDRLWVMR